MLDWAKKCWKEMLTFQRKSMWFEDTIDKLASWMGLRQGMTAIDVGCGLGYLGYTYWRYFGQGGRYFGIDISPELIEEATKAAEEWVVGGEATFLVGNAYRLPFLDDYADLVMCQTLLMHLAEPARALSEMIRVAKPGGLILCNEPDNHNPSLGKLHNSIPARTTDEHLLHVKVHLLSYEGRIKLGRGDHGIGPKVARMLKQLGLVDIDVRMNDQASYLEPPYESPRQQDNLEMIKRMFLDEDRQEILRGMEKEEFLAGGGDLEEYERYRDLSDKYTETLRKQIDAGEYFACGASYFYAAKARKPDFRAEGR